MILTHFIALLGPALAIGPVAGTLPLASSSPGISSGRLAASLLPAVHVRAAAAVLAVRER